MSLLQFYFSPLISTLLPFSLLHSISSPLSLSPFSSSLWTSFSRSPVLFLLLLFLLSSLSIPLPLAPCSSVQLLLSSPCLSPFLHFSLSLLFHHSFVPLFSFSSIFSFIFALPLPSLLAFSIPPSQFLLASLCTS